MKTATAILLALILLVCGWSIKNSYGATPQEVLEGKVAITEAMCETPKGYVHCFVFADPDEMAKAKTPDDLTKVWLLMEDEKHEPSQILEVKKGGDKPKVIWDRKWKGA